MFVEGDGVVELDHETKPRECGRALPTHEACRGRSPIPLRRMTGLDAAPGFFPRRRGISRAWRWNGRSLPAQSHAKVAAGPPGAAGTARASACGTPEPSSGPTLSMVITAPDGAPRVVLVNPPALPGRTNDRTLSGGLGVSRKLKPFERERVAVPPIDVLYLAAVASGAGASVAVVDLLLERLTGRAAERWCVRALGPPGGPPPWIGIRISMPSLVQDIALADRL